MHEQPASAMPSPSIEQDSHAMPLPASEPLDPSPEPTNRGRGRPIRKGPYRKPPLRLRDSLLPQTLSRLNSDVNAFRRSLEDAVFEMHGKVSILHASLINAAVRAERSARACQSLLRRHASELGPLDQATMHERVSKLTQSRDAAIGKLKLDEPLRTMRQLFDSIDVEGK